MIDFCFIFNSGGSKLYFSFVLAMLIEDMSLHFSLLVFTYDHEISRRKWLICNTRLCSVAAVLFLSRFFCQLMGPTRLELLCKAHYLWRVADHWNLIRCCLEPVFQTSYVNSRRHVEADNGQATYFSCDRYLRNRHWSAPCTRAFSVLTVTNPQIATEDLGALVCLSCW